ncbi:HAD-superfamily hydrolase, subfamily IA, variant 3 family protein [Methylococcus capsulatus str. Bath]|uniref:HAD-superfamily hydrolase, subfamily IA, variant 3 family protein n=1 Tax=Methylococcus capsulatus (strain ATCC 33009 / NCIMB 11132 / Bath) TaxID=243233 RepID=Q603R7_METCA|nr:HAD family phosphatase [Methylococcus capsulatus]AAU91193.1 HAD-superfamily hydrolase, subfamily IA, variant 3 family protein [Methylococcus capsulatus str. Bath]
MRRTDSPLTGLKAAILDMDGLAIDTEATYVAAWRGAAAALGFELDEAFCQSLFGCHAEAVKRRIGDCAGPGFDLRRFDALATRIWRRHVETHGIAAMPGLENLLRFFRERNLPYALATNSEARFAAICLDRSGLTRWFPLIVTRDQVAEGKPAPDLYLEAARRLGVEPDQCLALEDSETGIESAASAGTFAILVNGRRKASPRERCLARLRVASLQEIPPLWNQGTAADETCPRLSV